MLKPVEKKIARNTGYKYADNHYINYDLFCKLVFYGLNKNRTGFKIINQAVKKTENFFIVEINVILIFASCGA